MNRSGWGVFGVVLWSMCLLGSRPTVALSADSVDFRVDNEVFFGGRKDPDSRSTTIFFSGTVYDYLEEPPEVIVFDKSDDRFVLLDTARRVRTAMTTGDVLSFTRGLRREAEAHRTAWVRFLAAPHFEEHFDAASDELTLTSPWMVYRLTLIDAGGPTIARQYREFCDWYARLNTLLNPGSKPPFARLAVNAAVARRETTPREVRLTLTPEKTFPPKRTTIRSRHHLVRRLAKSDRDRVEQTRQFMEIFERVPFEEYRRSGQP